MKILVLAGGFDQIALIRELQKRGNIVYLADFFENPPAKKYADKYFCISTLDEDAIYKLACEEQVSLITTACTDQALMTVAAVSERLGLPCYISSEIARNVTNKAYMKDKFSQYGIPTAKWKLLESELDCNGFKLLELTFPLIVKPCDCNSSKGVVRVKNQIELEHAVRQAFQLSRSKKVIVEEFKEGDEVSIDVWKDREGAKILSVSRTCKIKENTNNFTIYQSKYPVEMSDTLIEKIRCTAEKICGAFRLDNCPLLIQAIIQGEDFNVIEFSARMGGGSKYKLIEHTANVDIMKIYVNRILGDESQIIEPVWSKNKMELNYVYGYNGIFSSLVGFDNYLKTGEIKELFQYKTVGSEITKRITSSDRIVGFLIEADSMREINELRIKIIDNVDILDVNKNSMMYKECFYG